MSQNLYKYFSLSSEKNLNRFFELLNGEAFFSSPNYFNDPFELSPSILPPTQDQLLARIPSESLQNLNKSQIKNVLLMTERQISSDNTFLSTKGWLNDFGILCVTEDPMSLLMWAHYGNSYRGACIGIDSRASLLKGAQKVNYRKIRPAIPFYANQGPSSISIKETFFTKSEEWKYEKEWRVVKRLVRDKEKDFYRREFEINPEKIDAIAKVLEHEGGPGKYVFPTEEIRNIYFGPRICCDQKQKIVNFIYEANLKIKTYQLNLDDRYYMLTKETLKPERKKIRKNKIIKNLNP